MGLHGAEVPGPRWGWRVVAPYLARAAAQADGNSVVAKLDDGLYMLYGHLEAGSLKVKLGDRVRRGDLLGLVGNSGNSSAPICIPRHGRPVAADLREGVPYVIDKFMTRGRLRLTAVFDEFENTTTRSHPPFGSDQLVAQLEHRQERLLRDLDPADLLHALLAFLLLLEQLALA